MEGPAAASDHLASHRVEAAKSTMAQKDFSKEALAQAPKAVHRELLGQRPSPSRVHSLASGVCNHWGQAHKSLASSSVTVVPWSILALVLSLVACRVRDR